MKRLHLCAPLVVLTAFAAAAQIPDMPGVPELAEFDQKVRDFLPLLEQGNAEQVNVAIDDLYLLNHHITRKMYRNSVRLMSAANEFAFFDNEGPSDVAESASSLSFDANNSRTMGLIMADVWLDSGQEEDRLEALDHLNESRQLDAQAASALIPHLQQLATMTVPPALDVQMEALDQPTRPNASVGIPLTITNYGDEPAVGVQLTLATSEDMGVGESVVDLADIPPGESLQHKVLVYIPEAAGRAGTVQVIVRAEGASPTADFTVLEIQQ
jgi:hypothetical protein